MPENQDLAHELRAMLQGCGSAIRTDRAIFRATGPDSTRWLNGMTTNSVQALAPGEGAYSFFLNAQGRIQGDATIYREREEAKHASYFILTSRTQAETLQPMLDHFIIMDDVELVPPSSTDLVSLLLLGPRAPEVLSAILPDVPTPAPLRAVQAGNGLLLFTPAPASTPRFELIGHRDDLTARFSAARLRGAQPVSSEALEALRVYEGIPLFGTDIRDRDLPQETAQTHALHFNKGCYLGQEIVERIRSRGQVHRQFSTFRLEGTSPEALPATLESNGKPAGELTSAATVPLSDGSAVLALGYARREFLETGAPLTYAGGAAIPRKAGTT